MADKRALATLEAMKFAGNSRSEVIDELAKLGCTREEAAELCEEHGIETKGQRADTNLTHVIFAAVVLVGLVVATIFLYGDKPYISYACIAGIVVAAVYLLVRLWLLLRDLVR